MNIFLIFSGNKPKPIQKIDISFSSRKEIKLNKQFETSSSNNPSVNTKVNVFLAKFKDFNFKTYNKQSFILHLL